MDPKDQQTLDNLFQQLMQAFNLPQPQPQNGSQPIQPQPQTQQQPPQQQQQPPQPQPPSSPHPQHPEPAVQVDPDHDLVPVDSFTSSPTSSTGSASILEWHSDAESAGSGEMLDLDLDSTGTNSEDDFLPSSDAESDGSAPVMISRSGAPSPEPPLMDTGMEMSFSLPVVPLRESAQAPVPAVVPHSNPGPNLGQGEDSPAPQSQGQVNPGADVDGDTWTSLFSGLMPPAPIDGMGMNIGMGLGPGHVPISMPAPATAPGPTSNALDDPQKLEEHIQPSPVPTFPPPPPPGGVQIVGCFTDNDDHGYNHGHSSAQDNNQYDAAYDGATKVSIPPGFNPVRATGPSVRFAPPSSPPYSSLSAFQRTLRELDKAFYREYGHDHNSDVLPSYIDPGVVIVQPASSLAPANVVMPEDTPSPLPGSAAAAKDAAPSRIPVPVAISTSPATPDVDTNPSIPNLTDTDLRPLRLVGEKDALITEGNANPRRECRMLDTVHVRQWFVDDSEDEGERKRAVPAIGPYLRRRWKGKQKAVELSDSESNSNSESEREREEDEVDEDEAIYESEPEYEYEDELEPPLQSENVEFGLPSRFGPPSKGYAASATSISPTPVCAVPAATFTTEASSAVALAAPLTLNVDLETPPSPAQSPLVASELFKTPVASSPASSRPESPSVFEHRPHSQAQEDEVEDTEAGVISIAEYFQLKALTSLAEEHPVVVLPLPEREREHQGEHGHGRGDERDQDQDQEIPPPPRPDSANSGLSYFTGRRSASPSSPSPPSLSPPLLSLSLPPLTTALETGNLTDAAASAVPAHAGVDANDATDNRTSPPLLMMPTGTLSPYPSYGYLPLTQTPEPRDSGLNLGLGSPVFGSGHIPELTSPEPAFNFGHVWPFAPAEVLKNAAGLDMFAPSSPEPVSDPFVHGAETAADARLLEPTTPPPDAYMSMSALRDGLFAPPSPGLESFPNESENGVGTDPGLFGLRESMLSPPRSESGDESHEEPSREASLPLDAQYPQASAGMSPYSSRSNTPALLSRRRESFLDYQDSRASSPEDQQHQEESDEQQPEEEEEKDEERQPVEERGSVHLHRVSSFEYPRRTVPSGSPIPDRNHGTDNETPPGHTPSSYVPSRPMIPSPPFSPSPTPPAASVCNSHRFSLPRIEDLGFPTLNRGPSHYVPNPPAASPSESTQFSLSLLREFFPNMDARCPGPPRSRVVMIDPSPSSSESEEEEEELIRSFVSSPLISSASKRAGVRITGRSSGRYGVVETDDEEEEEEDNEEEMEEEEVEEGLEYQSSNEDDDDQESADLKTEARREPREGPSDAPIPNVPSWLTAWGTFNMPPSNNDNSSSARKTPGYNAPPPPPPPPRQLPPLPNVVGAAVDNGRQGRMPPLGPPPPLPPLRCPSPPPVPPAQTTRQQQPRQPPPLQCQIGANPMRTSAAAGAPRCNKAEVTPKFALRPVGAAAQNARNDCYAAAFPSSWSQAYQNTSCTMISDGSPWSSPATQPTVLPPAPTAKTAEATDSQAGNGMGGQSLDIGVDGNAMSNSNLTSSQRMSHFFNSPASSAPSWYRPFGRPKSNSHPGSDAGSNSNSNSLRDLPNPYGAGSTPNPQYTGSTLPKDRTVPPPAPPPWEYKPPQRRLRFAPLPPTPGYRPGPPPVIPPFHPHPHTLSHAYGQPPPLPPPPPLPQPYIYQTPVPPPPPPVIPPVVPAVPPPPQSTTSSSSEANSNLLSSNSYPSSKRYWLPDGTIIFRVENCLYRVHRHFFELHSNHLSHLLGGYWYEPNSHFFLPDVKKVEFERLLSIFYPSDLAKSDITTVSGWTSILELSNKWRMPQVRALAIQKLAPLTTAVEKIAIAKKHSLPFPEHREWLIPAYTELCARRSPLTLEEAEDLDLPTVLKVWEVQHAVMGSDYSCSDDKVRELVKQKFGFADGPNGSSSGGGVPFLPLW